jgi:hypothetical protein
MAKNTAPRYRIGKARSGWFVEDTRTGGAVMTGMVQVGARQVADRLNTRQS